MSRLVEAPKPTIKDRGRLKDNAIFAAALLTAPLLIPATGLFDFAIRSTGDGKKACLDVARGRSLRRHNLKGKFTEEFDGKHAVGGHVGPTDLVVEEVVMTPGSDRVARARFGGRLTRTNTKAGVRFGMEGGETVYVADGETRSLEDDINVTFNDSTKTPTR